MPAQQCCCIKIAATADDTPNELGRHHTHHAEMEIADAKRLAVEEKQDVP
jgi:hypothetical protein